MAQLSGSADSLIAPSGYEYIPLDYSEDDVLQYDLHALFKFMHPVVETFQFLNVRITDPNGNSAWAVQNLPVVPFATERPIHYRMDLGPLGVADFPEFLEAEILVGAFQVQDTFTGTVFTLVAQPTFNTHLPNGARIEHDPPVIPYFPPFFPPIELPDDITGMVRGCEVPNIDLDDSEFGDIDPDDDIDDGDYQACGPAAAANSMWWLLASDPNILDTFDLRDLIEDFKEMMNKKPDSTYIQYNEDSTEMEEITVPGGVYWYDLVKGKLELIDLYELPVSVKYQTHTPNSSTWPEIESPVPDYGHSAQNQTGSSGIPDFDWICQELENGEDVELFINYWCQSETNPDSMVHQGGHFINLIGYASTGNRRWLAWKHDLDQLNPGGMIEEFGRWGLGRLPTDSTGSGPKYPLLYEMSDESSAGCVAYVGSSISESYDSTLTFCDKYIENTNDDGPGSLREALECAEDGDTIVLSPALAGQIIKLQSGLLVGKNIAIVADPDDDITIRFDSDDGFTIQDGGDLTLEGLTIMAGTGGIGSAITNFGTTTLRDIDILNHEGGPPNSNVVVNKGTMKVVGGTSIKEN